MLARRTQIASLVEYLIPVRMHTREVEKDAFHNTDRGLIQQAIRRLEVMAVASLQIGDRTIVKTGDAFC